MSVIKFTVSDVDVIDRVATADFTTDSISFDNSHDWSVSFSSTGITGGPPTYTVEVSNDDSTWFPWSVASTDIGLGVSPNDNFMPYKHLRVVYENNVTTAGTVTLELNIANDK